jgi:adenylate cyclase
MAAMPGEPSPSVAGAAAALLLVPEDGGSEVRLVPGRGFIVGRSAGCDLPLRDPTVSRRHAELTVVESGLRIRDFGSTNGTFVNGARVGDALVPPGSRVAFGKVGFEVRSAQAAAAPRPAVAEREALLDATILRQVHLGGRSDIAAQLSDVPVGDSLLRIAGVSTEERQARKLNLLLDIARELSRHADADALLDRVAGLSFQVMSVDRVALLLAGEDGGGPVPRVWRSRIAGSGDDWRVPPQVAHKVFEERVAVLVENLEDSETETRAGTVQSALCAPLLGGEGRVLGLIYLENLGAAQAFSAEDLDFLTAFSGMVAVAVENSRLVERARREAEVLGNFQRYFAPDLARQIAGQQGAVQLGGVKRPVAVLFSDIRGFTSISERMGPDEIATLLTEYFTEMVEIVFEHGGTLDKFMGDALMALWGAPLARDDDADRAVRAAVAMQQALRRLNQKWAGEGRRTLSVGIGINAGEVFAGNIGSERRLEYTVIGDAVNVAARLCAEAGPGEILIAQPLFEAVSQCPAVHPLPPLPLRGKSLAVPVYRVEW